MNPRVAQLKYICFLAALVCSCARGFSVSDLYGTYVASYSFGTDKIVLKNDGTYMQEVTIKKEQIPYTTTGKWEYDKASNHVIIENCYIVSNGLGQLSKNYKALSQGPSIFPVERDMLSRRIRLGPGEGNPYKKIRD